MKNNSERLLSIDVLRGFDMLYGQLVPPEL